MKCEGKGYIEYETMTDYHKREYDTYYVDCSVCKTSGLLLKTETVKVEHEPFTPGVPEKLKEYKRDKVSSSW